MKNKLLSLILFTTCVMATSPDWSERFARVTSGELATAVANSHGVAAGDYDGDGDIDFFVANADQPSFLFRNQGSDIFTRVTGQPLVQTSARSTVCAWGDYDNDGDLDLLVGNTGQQPVLWRNDGTGTFVQATEAGITGAGGECYAAAWADYDNDAWLDLIILSTWNCNYLFHNNGDGTFTRVTSGPVVSEAGAAVGCGWGDYDNDGWLDLFVAYGGGQNNRLFHNNRDGTFIRITTGQIVNDGGESVSCDWGDYDNDGWLDLFVANRLGDNFLYHNNGDGTFTKVTTGSIVSDGGESNGCAWADFDNDGWLDLVVSNWQGGPNFLYRNNGNGTFTRITAGDAATLVAQSVGVAAVDYNGDGFADLLVTDCAGSTNSLFRNVPNGNNWIKVRCIGTRSNRSAIGARVSIRTTVDGVEQWQTRQLCSAHGWGGGSPEALFGVGSAPAVDVVRVDWPSGTVFEQYSVSPNQVVQLTEQPPLISLSPLGCEFAGSLDVVIHTSLQEAEIHYTGDGSTPSLTSPRYTKPLRVTESCTITAAAFLDGLRASPVISQNYVKKPVVSSCVVPAQFANLEDDGWGNVLSRSERVQEVYASSHFPKTPVWITEIRFRPNAGDNPKTGTASDFQLNLSTTAKSPEGLSPLFAENIGPDETVVFKGSLTVSTSVSGPPSGPHPFDMHIHFDKPFLYEPAKGNLLLDFRNYSGGTIAIEEGCNEISDGASRAFNLDPNSPTAFCDSGAHVLEFVYLSQVSSISASPPPGNFVNSVVVSLSSSVPGCEIHYTLDGSQVVLSSPSYSQPIVLTDTLTIRARAFLEGLPVSLEMIATYTRITPPGPGQHSIVVPARFENVEDDGWGNVLSQRERVQEVYAASHFPPLPIWIKEIRFRPNAGDSPKSGTSVDFQLNLSTTKKAPDALSFQFAENVGSDDTTVFKGPLAITTAVSGPPEGPRDFDMVLVLDKPFMYDPAQGNLLLDFRNFSGGSVALEDGCNEFDDGASRAWNLDPNGLTATVDTGAHVLEFIYDTEPPVLWLEPSPGSYDRSVLLVMQTGVANGVIHFTLDGSEPVLESPAYAAPLKLTGNTTVKARVFVGGNPASDVVTGEYMITITPPNIASAPASQSVVEGGNVTFAAEVTGSQPITCQWALGGVPIPGQTNSTLSLVNVGFDDAGTYSLAATNEAGGATKDLLTLTVTPKPVPPLITVQPESIMVVTGSVAIFTVVATGTEPMSYSWRRGSTLVGTSPTLTITDVSKAHAGQYRVRVANMAGQVYSDYATLEVFDAHVAPEITSATSSTIASVGEPVVFGATAKGTLPLAWQWYKNGQPVAGATNSTLLIREAQLSDAGTYVLVVTNPAGSAATAGAVLKVWKPEIGGTVNFNNIAPPSGVDAPIFDSDGVTRLSGSAFLAQLYAGPDADHMAAIDPAVPFETGLLAGYVHQKVTSRTITSVQPGQPAAVQVRVWESAFGPTFETAAGAGGKTGASEILTVTTGGTGEPPSLPADLVGLRSFSVQRESVPPVIVITSPGAGTTADERVALTGSITDNVGIASARWERDGQPAGSLAPDGAGNFEVAGLRLHRGENVFRVVALDVCGNQSTAEVTVLWQPLRTLALVGPESEQEGRRVTFDVVLTSAGDVGGLSFFIRYSTDLFRDLSFTWSDALVGSSVQVNLEVPGEIQATLSLPGTAIQPGSATVGTLSLRARSVPAPQATSVALDLIDVADALGNRFAFGSDAVSGQITVLPRKIRGDNNGNDRLDIGDATVIQRYLVGLELVRSWDIVGNDLNQEPDQAPALDSGDVVKVLRAVVGLDPQPELPGTGLHSAHLGHAGLADDSADDDAGNPAQTGVPTNPWSAAKVAIVADRARAAAGETIIVQVRLDDLPDKISGAAFRLSYPGPNLVLREPVRAGAMAPVSPAPLVSWNVKNGGEAEPIQLTCAISSAQAWENKSGILAELTFEVLASGGFGSPWPMAIDNLEVTTSDGYDLYTLPAAAAVLNPLPVLSPGIVLDAEGAQGSFTGLAGSTYQVEVSADLKTWATLAAGVNVSGTVVFRDPFAHLFQMRFYRVNEW